MVDENKTRPIVVKRVNKHADDHHGGSWKIAFADFMTAMFAIFLVLWLLLALDDDQRAGIGQYFRDPTGQIESRARDVIDFEGERRAPIALEGMPIHPPGMLDVEEMQDLAEDFQDAVLETPELDEYRDQILVEVTDDGLRIQLVDQEGRPMFAVGGSEPEPHLEEILTALAEVLEDVPNPLSISGHTDARPFGRDDYDNWMLSTDRANAARRTLIAGGLPSDRFGQVVGYADTIPFEPDDPRADINRRISIVLMSESLVERIAERERRMDPEAQSIEAMERQPRDMLTPEERRFRDQVEELQTDPGLLDGPEPQEEPGPPDGGEQLLEPDELPGEQEPPEAEDDPEDEADGMPDLEPPQEPETW